MDYQQKLEADRATAQRAAASIERIQRIKLPGDKGWKYVAVKHDGTSEVVRAKATRSYPFAHLYDAMVCSGKPGLGAVITFSSTAKAPKGFFSANALKTFTIVE